VLYTVCFLLCLRRLSIASLVPIPGILQSHKKVHSFLPIFGFNRWDIEGFWAVRYRLICCLFLLGQCYSGTDRMNFIGPVQSSPTSLLH